MHINPGTIKKAIICKNVSSTILNTEINQTHIPKAGDVAIFEVVELGKHTRIQSENGLNTYILPGDQIMAAFGNRYATGQMEGYVPNRFHEIYHILGQGGAIGVVKKLHKRYELKGPTKLKLVGYIVNEENEVVNTKKIPTGNFLKKPMLSKAKIILSLGTSMDSGKTTSAAFLSRGLKNAGKKVAYIKLTGTVYEKDKTMVKSYGADFVIDFSDLGFPSTFMCSTQEIMNLYKQLLAKAYTIKPDYIIVEIADGLLQRETHALIHHPTFKKWADGVLFSAQDSMSAIAGANILKNLGYNLIGTTGLLTRSPLLIEEIKNHSPFKVFTGEDLMSKEIITEFEKKISHAKNENKMAFITKLY